MTGEREEEKTGEYYCHSPTISEVAVWSPVDADVRERFALLDRLERGEWSSTTTLTDDESSDDVGESETETEIESGDKHQSESSCCGTLSNDDGQDESQDDGDDNDELHAPRLCVLM